MNKLFIYAAACSALALSACSTDTDPAVFTTGSKTNALVVQKTNPDNAFVVPDIQLSYSFNSDKEVDMNMASATFGNLGKLSFVANGTYQFGNIYTAMGQPTGYLYKLNIIDIKAEENNIPTMSCILTDAFWDDPENSIRRTSLNATIMQFTVNADYQVRTFPTRAVYPGQTKVYHDGAMVKTFDQLQYIVTLHLDKMTADVKLYNPDMNLTENPQYQTLWLRNLDLVVDNRGYYIIGAGVVPAIENGNSWTEVTEYTFDTFRMQMIDDQLIYTTVEAKTVDGYTLSLPSGSYLMVKP